MVYDGGRKERCIARTAEHTPTTRLTIKQAADILNVDKSYLVQLLDEEKIPFTGKGPQRDIRHDDLFAYKRERDAIRRQALLDLTRHSQEAGLDQIDYREWLAEYVSDPS